MNEINFLPPSFLKRGARRRRVFRQLVILAFAAACADAWYTRSSTDLSAARAYAANLEAQVAASRDRAAEITRLEARRQALTARMQTHHELVQPVNSVQVTAAVGRLLPPALALKELNILGRRPAPASSGASTPSPVEPLKVEMVGLAPADVEVADFVGKLSDYPLFVNVKMLYSRAVQAGDLQAREFRVELEVPLDREYRPLPAPGMEVAHAD